MKRQNASDAGHFTSRECLGHTCGTNIDTEGVEFTRQKPNLTLIDKVFSFNKDTASPILFNLNTGGMQSGNFVTELFLEGSCFFPCTLSPNAVFEIDNSFVAVDFFSTRPPGNINASQVTVDGFPVDSVSFANGQYTARTDNVLARVLKNRCLERDLPTKVFFLISNAGPWDFRATYVLEGTVNTNGRNCRFRAVISNAPNAPNSMLPNNGLSSFTIRDLSLPCSVNGIAPEIQFQFNAKINLVNPRLVPSCNTNLRSEDFESTWTSDIDEAVDSENLGVFSTCKPPHHHHPCPPTIISPSSCTVALMSTVSVEPIVNVQSVRKTLFCINACEGIQPCDGSLRAAEEEDNAEDCEVGGRDRPDCRCKHRRKSESRDTCREISEELEDSDVCSDLRSDFSEVSEISDRRKFHCRSDLLGTRDRRFHFRDEMIGENDRRFVKKLAREICEELGENTSDITHDHRRRSCTDRREVTGFSESIRSEVTRTASRLHSFNGCGW